MTLDLHALTPFASGGNRLCFVHPHDAARCIKVRRPDFTLEDLRRKKGFPKNLRPLSYFDDNLEEFHVMRDIATRLGDEAFSVISHCHGFEDTSLGKGLVSELIRDSSGRISRSLKQYVYDHGHTDDLQRAVSSFIEVWTRLAIPSRDLLVHNLVVQCDEQSKVRRIVAIDGLGNPSPIPEAWLPRRVRQARSVRKTMNLQQRIQELLAAKTRNEPLGTLGVLIHDGTQPRT